MRWLHADLCSQPAVEQLLEEARPDVIFHLAGYVSGTRALSEVLPVLQANCVAAVNLLSVAASRGVERIVLAGSLEEPDHGEAPSSPYAAAKSATTAYARMFHALYATPVTIARIFMVYGPGQADSTKLVPHVIRSLLSGQTPRLGSGQRQVDWVYVDDVVRGLIAIGATPGLAGATLDIGSGTLRPISQVVRELYSILAPDADPCFGTLPDRPLEVERAADLTAVSRQTEWRPCVDLRAGLHRTVEYYATLTASPQTEVP